MEGYPSFLFFFKISTEVDVGEIGLIFKEVESKILDFKKEFPKIHTGIIFHLVQNKDQLKIRAALRNNWCVVWSNVSETNEFYDAEGFEKKKETLQFLCKKMMDKEIPSDCVHLFHNRVEMKYSAAMSFTIKGAKVVDDIMDIDEYRQLCTNFAKLKEVVVFNKTGKNLEKFQIKDGIFEKIISEFDHPVDTFSKEYMLRRVISALTSDEYDVKLNSDGTSLKIEENGK